MMNNFSGFREVEHTADWELQVWAPDILGLLEQAARGMLHLSQIKLREDVRINRELRLPIQDRESLLVDFLSELLYLAEDKNLAFDEYQLEIQDETLLASVRGAAIEVQAKEIKAVTYHRMQVRETELGLEVNIVFDV